MTNSGNAVAEKLLELVDVAGASKATIAHLAKL
jgi:hypothetical protein